MERWGGINGWSGELGVEERSEQGARQGAEKGATRSGVASVMSFLFSLCQLLPPPPTLFSSPFFLPFRLGQQAGGVARALDQRGQARGRDHLQYRGARLPEHDLRHVVRRGGTN